ncbi:low-affinity Zn(2+) transporter zrt2 [Sporothrix epigloea]|uniref:Low-affinity Zn(2+) transporter zrt2 n=1 Tax=Sporothrix epigloea TaxID=1892477 RepID=A0ABP0E776_9PEZI
MMKFRKHLSTDSRTLQAGSYTYLPIMRQYNAIPRDDAASIPQCTGWGTDLSDKGLRIASIFIIFAGSMLGVFLPMLLARTAPRARFAKLSFFVCKYFGSGVILATAFMHLLSPAVEALSDACLADILPEYDWGHLICLISIMTMFHIELMATRFNFSFSHSHGGASFAPSDGTLSKNNTTGSGHAHSQGTKHSASPETEQIASIPSHNNGVIGGLAAYATATDDATRNSNYTDDVETGLATHRLSTISVGSSSGNKKEASANGLQSDSTPSPHSGGLPTQVHYPPGNPDHLAHDLDHVPGDSHGSYGSQIVSLLILEFGVVFHSLFIGLSLAGSSNLRVLLIVIAFHQFFEGLGLGSRLAVAEWPSRWKAWTGYMLALGYGVTTPIGIAIGLGVNAGLNSRPALSQLINGVFDAVSSGILVYTALVELLAHEFMFNPEMRDAKMRVQMLAFACVAFGLALMALLAKWA